MVLKEVNMFRDIPCQKDLYYFYYLAYKSELINDEQRFSMLKLLIQDKKEYDVSDYVTANEETVITNNIRIANVVAQITFVIFLINSDSGSSNNYSYGSSYYGNSYGQCWLYRT